MENLAQTWTNVFKFGPLMISVSKLKTRVPNISPLTKGNNFNSFKHCKSDIT